MRCNEEIKELCIYWFLTQAICFNMHVVCFAILGWRSSKSKYSHIQAQQTLNSALSEHKFAIYLPSRNGRFPVMWQKLQHIRHHRTLDRQTFSIRQISPCSIGKAIKQWLQGSVFTFSMSWLVYVKSDCRRSVAFLWQLLQGLLWQILFMTLAVC